MGIALPISADQALTVRHTSTAPAIEICGLTRQFGALTALDGVDLLVAPGEIHALLGPNGAGKTTLLRTLSGLVDASDGVVRVGGVTDLPRCVGFVPSGDRSFYLRLSGLENLRFFARLQGLRRREAVARAKWALAEVDLAEAGSRAVMTYSHGMQKRLLVARALLVTQPVLLIDEATHDLDPEAAERIRALVRDLADRGHAVLWTTQRVEEIRGFADNVTVLAHGQVRFCGPVAGLLAHSRGKRYVLRLDEPASASEKRALAKLARLTTGDHRHVVIELRGETSLGEAIAALTAAGATVRDCRQERAEAEHAYLAIVGTEDA